MRRRRHLELDAHPFPLGHRFHVVLGSLAARAAVADAAERNMRLGLRSRAVHMHHAGADLAREPHRMGEVSGEDGR